MKLKAFSKLYPVDKAKIELLQAEESLLEAQSNLEYQQALVKYNTDRIARLTKYLETKTVDIKSLINAK